MKKALLIVDHGSVVQASNDMLNELAVMLRIRRPELIVHAAHMDVACPTISDGIEACIADGAQEVVVHPYMLSPGRHAMQDVPRLVEVEAERFPEIKIRVTLPLGLHQKIGDIILERAQL